MIIANEDKLVEAVVELFQGKIPLRLITNAGGGNIGTFKREWLKRTAKYEKDYLKVVLPLLKSIAEEVKKNVRNHPNNPKFWTFNVSKRKRELIVSEAKMIAKIYPLEGQMALNLVLEKPEEFAKAETFIGISFDIEDERAIEQATKRANKIGSVAGNLHNDLHKKIASGIKEGLPMEEIAKTIVNYVELRSVSTALMVARTETIWASNAGAEMGYTQSGVVEGKQWLGGQSGICDICLDMDGMTAPLGGSFDVSAIMDKYGITFDYTEGAMPFPPLHPNCRCTIVPITKIAGIGKELIRRDQLGKIQFKDNVRLFMEDAKKAGKVYSEAEADKIISEILSYTADSADIRVFWQGGEAALRKKLKKDWGTSFFKAEGERYIGKANEVSKYFEEFFKTAPRYEKKVIYRGLELKKAEIKELVKMGNIIEDKGIASSWSSEFGVSGKFDANVVLKMVNDKGVGIKHISQFPDEAEILMPKVKLQITGYESVGAGKNKVIEVTVKEVL